MDKVLLTTYRKLYKMCSRVDRSTGMRSVLSCAPSHVYNHRRGKWVPINVAELSRWAESRIFLDNLIRRLNGGRQFYIPPTIAADRAHAGKKMAELARHATAVGAAVNAAETTSHPSEGGADSASESTATAATEGSTTTSGGAAAAASFSAHGTSSSQVPLSIAPFSPLRQTLRSLFERTSFSMGNLNNGFAAVKELSYVCEVTDKHRSLVVKLPSELRSQPRPKLERVAEVEESHHVLLIKGLTDEIVESLRTTPRKAKRPRSSMAPPITAAAAAAVAGVTSAAPKNAFDDVEGDDEAGDGRRPTQSEEEEHENLFDEEADEAAEEEEEEGKGGEGAEDAAAAVATAAAGGVSSAVMDAAATAQAECNAAPKHVQLLLAHPQLNGFFRHSVLLVVRNGANEAAAFMINKPVENDEGLRMPVNATIRLNRVHPIFGRHLRDHTVMVGGPVMVGGVFDESVFLLHSIPDVPSALPLGNGLWLDGDLDKMAEKLDKGEAKPEQVVVICGFSGWGAEQLSGEVNGGTWVVVRGDAEDKTVTNFVMQVANVSGAHAAPVDAGAVERNAASSAADERVNPKEGDGADTEADAGTDEDADPARLAVRMSAGRRVTASWVWAYDIMGEPLASLATNQKPEPADES